MKSESLNPAKPLLRGHFHQAAFFVALGACSMLVAKSHGFTAITSNLIYAISIVGLFGMSALYHRPTWDERARKWMRRFDHSSIFLSIAGTSTPISIIGIGEDRGIQLLGIFWAAACLGIVKSFFWVGSPKWLTAALCLAAGCLALPFLPELTVALGSEKVILIIAGGIVYALGACVYAFKFPNPHPAVFGYHEVFHILVVVGAILHFIVIVSLT